MLLLRPCRLRGEAARFFAVDFFGEALLCFAWGLRAVPALAGLCLPAELRDAALCSGRDASDLVALCLPAASRGASVLACRAACFPALRACMFSASLCFIVPSNLPQRTMNAVGSLREPVSATPLLRYSPSKYSMEEEPPSRLTAFTAPYSSIT